MNIKLLLLFTALVFTTNVFANVGVTFDLLSPVGSALIDGRNEFDSDLRIDYGFKEYWSLGAQFNFIKSSEEDSSSKSQTVPANQVHQLQQVKDRNVLFFGRWYKAGLSVSSLYFGIGVGLAKREFSVFVDGKKIRDSSSGTIFSGQVGYQWMFAPATGLGFELNFTQSSVDENSTGTGASFSYDYKRDVEKIQPKILFTHRF